MHFDPQAWAVTDGQATIHLPELAVPAMVRVWRVPAEYRADGYFVAVQPIGQPEELPACDLRQCVKLCELAIDSHPQAALEALKAAKKRQIEAERDAQTVADVTAHGRRWQADKRSQELLGQAIALAQAGLPLPPVWRDADNRDMPVTSLADLLAIARAIAAQVQQAYATSWTRKMAVDAATTVEEIEAA